MFTFQTNDIGDFEMGVNFLNQLGSYYLEVDLKQKDLKHALAGLLVEILAPAAGVCLNPHNKMYNHLFRRSKLKQMFHLWSNSSKVCMEQLTN